MFPKARHEKLLVKEFGNELVVYDKMRHRAHRLNATAATIWRHCDGENSVLDLARLLEASFSLPPDESMVWLALHQLQGAHLLREPLGQLTIRQTSRRDVMKGLGIASTLAFLLPVVSSLTAPTPLMAQYASEAVSFTPP